MRETGSTIYDALRGTGTRFNRQDSCNLLTEMLAKAQHHDWIPAHVEDVAGQKQKRQAKRLRAKPKRQDYRWQEKQIFEAGKQHKAEFCYSQKPTILTCKALENAQCACSLRIQDERKLRTWLWPIHRRNRLRIRHVDQ